MHFIDKCETIEMFQCCTQQNNSVYLKRLFNYGTYCTFYLHHLIPTEEGRPLNTFIKLQRTVTTEENKNAEIKETKQDNDPELADPEGQTWVQSYYVNTVC